jgi:hypothetical protein
MRHAEQDGDCLLVRGVVEVESYILPWHGLVERGGDAVTGEDLSDDFLLIGVKVKALRAGPGQEGDWAGKGGGLAYPWLYLGMKYSGDPTGVNALANDIVLWIEETGLRQ